MGKVFGLYSNETAAKARESYLGLLREGQTERDAIKMMLKSADELGEGDEASFFWLAWADTMHDAGRLTTGVKERALWVIAKKGGMETWAASPGGEKRWSKILTRLRKKLTGPKNPKKTFKPRRAVPRDPWEDGDVYALELYAGGYIAVQKLFGGEFMTVAVFGRLFSEPPTLEELAGLRYVPMNRPYSLEKLSVALELRIATLREYPEKRLTYLGSLPAPALRPVEGERFSWRIIEALAPECISNWEGESYFTDENGVSSYCAPARPEFL